MVDLSALFIVALTNINYLNFKGSFSTYSPSYFFYNGTEAEFNKTFDKFLTVPGNLTSFGSVSVYDMTQVLSQGQDNTNAVCGLLAPSFSLYNDDLFLFFSFRSPVF